MRVRSRLVGSCLFALISSCASDKPSPQSTDSSSAGTTTLGEASSTSATDGASNGSTIATGQTTSSTSQSTSSTHTPSNETSPIETGSSVPQQSSSATDSTSEAPTFVDSGKRELLSQTGLYANVATETLGPRVKEYQPQFELWSDGALKRRWLYIPEGTQIDTSYVDEWQFPVGTKVWKEFSRDGVRVETRLIEKLPPDRANEGFQGWLYMTYIWNDDLTEAVATIDGLENAKGTDHDVPTQKMCGDCHDMRREKPLGVSAIQLSHNLPGATLDSLFNEGWLSAKPDAPLVVPGTEEERQLLGYFHANCGHCHREGAPANNRVSSLKLWLLSTGLSSVETSDAFVSLVNGDSESGQGSILPFRVVPGDPANSELMRRLLWRTENDPVSMPVDAGSEHVDVPMPPLGTEIVDAAAVERIRNWISSLSPTD